MSEHWHYASEIHGAATSDDVSGLRQELREVQSQADGLRQDLGAADCRIRDLEEQFSDLAGRVATLAALAAHKAAGGAS